MKTKLRIAGWGWVAGLVGMALLATRPARANPPIQSGSFVVPPTLASLTNTTEYTNGQAGVPVPRGNFDLLVFPQVTAAQTTNTNCPVVMGFDLVTAVPNGSTFTSANQPVLVTNNPNGTNFAWTSWNRIPAAQLNGATSVIFDYEQTASATAVTNNGVGYAFVPAP